MLLICQQFLRNLIGELDVALQKHGRVFLVLDERARSTAPRDYFVQPDTINLIDKTGCWLQAFQCLAEASRVIFIFPLLSPGVTKELHLLKRREMLSKCLVIMPPAVHVPGQMADERKWMRKEWEEVGSQFPEMRLPEYEPDGMVYVLNSDFSKGQAVSLRGTMSTINSAIHDLLPEERNGGFPICRAISQLMNNGFRWCNEDRNLLERLSD